MSRPIEWYFDVISPFAYLALGEVEELGQGSRPIIYRPILLGALLKHWGHLGPAEIPPKRIHTYRMSIWEAETRGIPFRMPPAHPFNPLRMLRLIAALGSRPDVVRRAMELIWREGRDGGSEETAQMLCRSFDVADADALIESSGAKDMLRRNTEAAIEAGLFGVPTLAVDGELFWGCDAMPMARAFLADPSMLSSGEMGRIGAIGEGVVRSR